LLLVSYFDAMNRSFYCSTLLPQTPFVFFSFGFLHLSCFSRTSGGAKIEIMSEFFGGLSASSNFHFNCHHCTNAHMIRDLLNQEKGKNPSLLHGFTTSPASSHFFIYLSDKLPTINKVTARKISTINHCELEYFLEHFTSWARNNRLRMSMLCEQ